MKKYLLSACVLSLLSATEVWASPTIFNSEVIIPMSQNYEGLDIGPKAQVKFCPLNDAACINTAEKLNFNVNEDIAVNGGTVQIESSVMSQTEKNRTQGVVLKDGANVSLKHTDLLSNSRLEINSGSSLIVGEGSTATIIGDKTTSSGQNADGEIITPGEIKVVDNGTLALKAGIIKDKDGIVIASSDTVVSGNSILTIENASLDMSAFSSEQVTIDTSLLVEDDIHISEGKIRMSAPEETVNTLRTTTGSITVNDSAIIGSGDGVNKIIAAENIVVSNNTIPVVEIAPEEDAETSDTENNATPDTNTDDSVNTESDTLEGTGTDATTNGNNALMNISLEAGKDIVLNTKGENVTATAGSNMSIGGEYKDLYAQAGSKATADMVVNANIDGGNLKASQYIDYQTGTAVLSGLNAKQTTIQKPANVTLSYGIGGGDIISKGVLTLENFQLTQGQSNNVSVVNSKLNSSWNNEIAGNLALENSRMVMKKDATNDGWLRVGNFTNTTQNRSTTGNVTIKNSVVDVDTSYIEASGTISIDSTSTVAMRIAGVPIADKSTYGHIIADKIVVENGAKMVLTVDGNALQKGQTENYELFSVEPENGTLALQKNSRYSYVDKGDGTYDITLNTTAADMAGEQTGDDELSQMAGSLLDGATGDNKFVQHLNELSQTPGREKEFADGLEALAPTQSAFVTALANDTTRQIYNVIGTRFDRDSYRSKRTRQNMPSNNLWAQALASKGEFEGARAFETDSKGGAIGFDFDPCPGCRFGLGYVYTQSDITAKNRTADVDSHAAVIYADMQGDPVYLNIIGTYMRSQYDEKKDVAGLMARADYDVDVLAAQAMLGYDLGSMRLSRNWRTGSLMPEIGVRYMFVKQHEYTDEADQKVNETDGQTITGVLGAHYTADYKMGSVIFYPDLRAAVTYDFVSDEMRNAVSLAGGTPYYITAERLDEFGVELGAEIGLRIANRVDIALSYLGMFRKDYTNHTGLANLKFRF